MNCFSESVLHIVPGLHMAKANQYTCVEYREEMMLLGLKRRLNDKTITEEEKQNILREIAKLEMAMDIC